MAVVKVVKKQSEIDGKPIEWNVLAIMGYMHGDYQTLELKLSKTEAMLANLLLASNEEKPEVTTSKASTSEQEEFQNKIKKAQNADEADFLND